MKILDAFSPISLEKLKERTALLKRHETKYLVEKDKLFDVLETLKEYYHILEIGQKRIFEYESCYFDTEDKMNYFQHHQGKRHRVKVRTRAYVDSKDLTYFEVKLKKKTQTFKYRIPIDRDNH